MIIGFINSLTHPQATKALREMCKEAMRLQQIKNASPRQTCINDSYAECYQSIVELMSLFYLDDLELQKGIENMTHLMTSPKKDKLKEHEEFVKYLAKHCQAKGLMYYTTGSINALLAAGGATAGFCMMGYGILLLQATLISGIAVGISTGPAGLVLLGIAMLILGAAIAIMFCSSAYANTRFAEDEQFKDLNHFSALIDQKLSSSAQVSAYSNLSTFKPAPEVMPIGPITNPNAFASA